MGSQRASRVASSIKEIVSEALMLKVKNQQAKKATVHGVDVTDNLRVVKIYVSSATEEKEKTMQALEKISGFLRREIGAQANLKFTPEIKFVYDDSLDNAQRIEQLLRDSGNAN